MQVKKNRPIVKKPTLNNITLFNILRLLLINLEKTGKYLDISEQSISYGILKMMRVFMHLMLYKHSNLFTPKYKLNTVIFFYF